MKVYVDPLPVSLSRAMYRVANALKKYAPAGIDIVEDVKKADLQILHTIGFGVLRFLEAPRYAVIQYCFKSANTKNQKNLEQYWFDLLWNKSYFTWSYYKFNLPSFYYAPLGIDEDFLDRKNFIRTNGVITSGYVSLPGQEAIEEVAIAANDAGITTIHIGPNKPQGMKTFPPSWSNKFNISDKELATLYNQSRWVSGLRYIEGFELPVIEGLACGARPIVFDRPEMRSWFDGHAVFIPECSGNELIERLIEIFSSEPEPITEEERKVIIEKFNWEKIIKGFWKGMSE